MIEVDGSQSKNTEKLRALVARFRDKYRLSQREATLLELGARGLSSKEAADRLACSIKTVDEHWRRIYVKWKLASRPRIVAAILFAALSEAPAAGSVTAAVDPKEESYAA